MGFLDKAKAAAQDLQQKADVAIANSGLMGGAPMGGGPSGPGGPADRLLRDLGVLTYLNAVGRPGPAADYQRIMEQLRALDGTGGLNLNLSPAAPAGYGAPGAPPPPPGAAAAAAAAAAAPPPPMAAPPPAGAAPAPMAAPPSAGVAPPPAPPAPAAAPPDTPAAQPAAESAPAVVAGEESGSGEIVDVEEEITDIGGGGGTGAPPPPPSWA